MRAETIVLCKFYQPGIEHARVKAQHGLSNSNGSVFVGAKGITLSEDWGYQATIDLAGNQTSLKCCVQDLCENRYANRCTTGGSSGAGYSFA